jgi:uncharacterized membrane protein
MGFVEEFFIEPIINPAVSGYNIVNTLVYGVILLLITFYIIYPRLNKAGLKFDWNFMKMLIPYILFGVSIRVLEDQQILTRSINPLDFGFYVFTPGIWILTFAMVLVGLGLGKVLKNKTKYSPNQLTMSFGFLIMLPFLLWNLSMVKEWLAVAGIGLLVLIISLTVFEIAKRKKWDFLNHKIARLAFVGQMIDASATFAALEFFSCSEQHVLPRLLFGAFGNISFFFVKIPIVLMVLYFLNKEFKKENDTNLYLFVLIFLSILGLATGLRDWLTIGVGTCG